MKRSLVLFIFFTQFFLACESEDKNQPVAIGEADSTPIELTEDTQITLTRSGCYGNCPAYQVTINAEGEVDFVLSKLGGNLKKETLISKEDIERILAKFSEIKFMSLGEKYFTSEDGCSSMATDFPIQTIGLSQQEKIKDVRHDLGCTQIVGGIDKKLNQLSSLINQIVKTEEIIRELRGE